MSTLSMRQNTSTPTTAIASSLSMRSAPSIPPASLIYEPLVKNHLARRFVCSVLTVSAASAWSLAAFWTSWQLGGIEALGLVRWIANWFAPSTLACAALWWSFGSVPVAVLRKSFIDVARSSSLSPQQALVHNTAQRRYRLALLVTITSSVALTLCHSLMVAVIERNGRGDPKISILVGSKKHPFRLNGRFLFLFLVQTIGSVLYCLRDILKDRFDVRWSRHSAISIQVLPSLVSSVISVAMLSGLSTVAATLVFAALRTTALPIFYKVPILHGLLRPLMAHFFKPGFTVVLLWSHSDVIIRAYLATFTSQLIWDITSTMFDVVFSFVSLSFPRTLILFCYLASLPSAKLHAFHELCSLASGTSEAKWKRTTIYADSKHDPTLWATIVRQSLLLLGTDYQAFLHRGSLPSTQAQPALAPKMRNKTETPSTPIIRSPVYKMPQASPIGQLADTISSDGPVAFLISSGLPTFSWTPSNLLKYNASNFIKCTISSPCYSVFSRHLVSSAGRNVATWWTRERKDKAVRKALRNPDLDCMIVEVLGTLISHSLLEDVLGHVQRDIPRILEAMLLYLSAVEDYHSQLTASMSFHQQDDRLRADAAEICIADECIDELTTALRTSIALIVHTFGERLTSFKFPYKIASRLQSFVDYSV
ncbi:nucleoporin protein Ndc1-Nup [Phellopilus nigrolimitatus]|nr:nucleoporin protein Ndc1-Nup [Phellopilus nigrolimitatus]